ncbi:MAG: hypothetical protein MUF64_02815 [Polyangiaceae bacterium]|nr:hypothetical protein [Polyangiaceae bacterium]
MVGSVCFFVTQRDGDIPNTGQVCQCDGQGKMQCPATGLMTEPVQVCITRASAACPAASDPQARAALNAQFEPGCPMLVNPTLSGEHRTPSGEAACCYRSELGKCQGRPLVIAGRSRLACVQRGSWG